MMQLYSYIDNAYFELYENMRLQVQRSNSLLAFDELKTERTMSFKMPATPKNNLLFQIGNRPEYSGSQLRIKKDCFLYYSGLRIDGYLYATEFDGKDYSCVFVFGQLLGLKEIKDAGDLNEILTGEEQSLLGATPLTPAKAANLIFAAVAHKSEISPIAPSISVNLLYERIASYFADTYFHKLPSDLAETRIVCPQKKVFNEICTLYYEGGKDNSQPKEDLSDWTAYNTVSSDCPFIEEYDDEEYNPNYTFIYSVLGRTRYFYLRPFVAKTDLTLSFPKDTPISYILFVDEEIPEGWRKVNGNPIITNCNTVWSGAPLAGNSITIQKGHTFLVVDGDVYFDCRTYIGDSYYNDYGWGIKQMSDYALQVEVKTTNAVGNYIRLKDNLPSIAATDFLKTCAHLSGKVLWYNPDGVVNLFERLEMRSAYLGVYDAAGGSFYSTREQNTSGASNYLRVQYYKDNTYIGQPKAVVQNTLGRGSIEITKSASWNVLAIVFNGNVRQSWVRFNCPDLKKGQYTLSWNITELDRSGDGNAARLEGLTMVAGTNTVYWEEWQKNKGGISFDDFDIGSFDEIELKEVTKRGAVKRQIEPFAQNNFVRFKNEATGGENYVQRNSNIAEEKVVATLPFSNGDSRGSYLYMNEDNAEQTIGDGGSIQGVAVGELLQAAVIKNVNLQALLTTGTQYNVQARLSFYEYARIKEKCCIIVDNVRYIWLSSTWNNGVADFVLARV